MWEKINHNKIYVWYNYLYLLYNNKLQQLCILYKIQSDEMRKTLKIERGQIEIRVRACFFSYRSINMSNKKREFRKERSLSINVPNFTEKRMETLCRRVNACTINVATYGRSRRKLNFNKRLFPRFSSGFYSFTLSGKGAVDCSRKQWDEAHVRGCIAGDFPADIIHN